MAYSPPVYNTTLPTGAMGVNESIALLKEVYNQQVVRTMTYKRSPLLAMLRKDTEAGGKLYPQPVITDASTGRSATFSTAQTNQGPARMSTFICQTVDDYSIAQISRKAMKSAATDKMAFLKTTRVVIDQAIMASANSLSSALYRDGTGSVASYANTAISTGVITLDDPGSIVNFSVGQVLESRATAGGTISTTGALGYVIAVNISGGTLTVSATAGGAAGTPTNWSVSFPYLNVQGDVSAAGEGGKITGLAGWVVNPTSISGADSFFSVNRSSDKTRLGGCYYDGSNQSIEEAIIDACSLVNTVGGEPDVFILSNKGYAALQKAMGSRAVTEMWVDEEDASIAFAGIVVNSPWGRIRCFPDRWCPGFVGYLLQLDTWTLISLGQAPEIFDYEDDTQFLRIYNADAAEIRIGYYAQLVCSAPGWNCQVKLVA